MSKQGICMIATNPAGAVVAHSVDFAGPDAAGFTKLQEQRRRAKARLLFSFAKSHLNHWMAEKVTHEDAYDFWRLAEASGYTMTEIKIGYEEDVS